MFEAAIALRVLRGPIYGLAGWRAEPGGAGRDGGSRLRSAAVAVVRSARREPLVAVLRAAGGERGEPGADAPAGRTAPGASFYGSRQMARHVRREGVVAGWHRVRRLMRVMGMEAIYRRPRVYSALATDNLPCAGH